MAAGAANSLTFPFLNSNSNVESKESSFWSADVMKTNSTLDVWDAVERDQLQRKVSELKRIFHNGRQLLLKHLPRDVTEPEIRELLVNQGLAIRSIHFATGGPGPNWARVILSEWEPELWEEWSTTTRDKVFSIRGHKVSIVPSTTENLLCVARLPRDLSEQDFRHLVASYGEIRRSFLMCSEKTGENKGYGFVEYQTKDCGLQARLQLDGRSYDGHVIACDWLDSNIVTFSGLHSKLLYVDGLPNGFRDMGEFRKLFSSVANPPYCQIALKGGAPQDWGLVEFSHADEAEETLTAMDGYLFQGVHIRTAYFVPGVRAINIYMKLINETCQNKGKAALLPEPPADTVFHQLQNLTKQNPAFVQSLQNIILTQIQNLNSGTVPNQGAGTGSNQKPPTANNNNLRGRGPSPSLMINHPPPQSSSSQNNSNVNAALAANAQAALSILLAAQQPPPNTTRNNGPPQPVPPPHAVPPPAIQTGRTITTQATYNNYNQNNFNKPSVPFTFPSQSPPVLETPPLNVNIPPPPLYRQPPPACVSQMNAPLPRPPSTPTEASTGDLQKTLSALLGTLNSAFQSLSPTPVASPQLPSPFASYIQQPSTNNAVPQVAAGALLGLLLQLLQGQQTNVTSPVQSALGPLTLNTPESYSNAAAPAADRLGLLTTAPQNSGLLNNFKIAPPPLNSPVSSRTWGPPQRESTSNSPAPQIPCWNHVLGQVRQMSSGPSSLGSAGSRGSSPTSSSSPSTSPGRTNSTNINNSFVTPIGTKRKYNHVLPSPEPSPDNGYIGQHSQGLGGHYADSYFKRKKRN